MLDFPFMPREGSPTKVSTGLGRLGRGLLLSLAAGTAAVTIAACGSSAPAAQGSGTGAGSNAGSNQAAAAPASASEALTLQVDADSGPAGWFTGKEDWPRYAPGNGKNVPQSYSGNVTFPANTTVTLTITSHDDGVTALPNNSIYNKVAGGTETVNGKPVTFVSNKQIAHTFTVTSLGINVPVPASPENGTVVVKFTFKTGAAGTYDWRCMTPCGSGAKGSGGAMAKNGWMRGTVTVA